MRSDFIRFNQYKFMRLGYQSKQYFQMIPENFEAWPKIMMTNEDYNFPTLLKTLHMHNIFDEGLTSLQCKQGAVRTTIGNRFKKVELEFTPYQGTYPFQFEGKKFVAKLIKGDCKLTTQCRQISYIRDLYIHGESLQVLRDFLSKTIEQSEITEEGTITIYQNNNGYWNVSKEKKPRKMESVIFAKEFIESVIDDIGQFIESEDWYTEMGIPYKRSYLLFGPPGTGKSSFAQALAGKIGYSICFVNCSDKISDFQFNSLLNKAPKKSIILIEDVDAIFSERKNTEKNNTLTFSGFLNSIDGVRSQQGRLLVMTTNYKQRLDPALLRPGRVDQMYQVSYASQFQMEGLCYRFFKDEKLAKNFGSSLPAGKFSMSMIQGFLLKYRKKPEKILQCITQILDSDQNVKIDRYLGQINCIDTLNDFKIQEIYTLSSARNLPKQTLQKIISRLSPLLKGRLLQTVRQDRKMYIKSAQQLRKFVQQNYKDEQLQRQLNNFLDENKETRTYYQIRDKAREIEAGSQKQKQIMKN